MDKDYLSDDPRRVKKSLVNYMSNVVENISMYYDWDKSWELKYGKCPIAFTPGTSDRIIFRDILTDKIMENIMDDSGKDTRPTNPIVTAMNILFTYYYPEYGQSIEDERRSGFE